MVHCTLTFRETGIEVFVAGQHSNHSVEVAIARPASGTIGWIFCQLQILERDVVNIYHCQHLS